MPVTFHYKPLDTGKSEIRVLKLPANSSENFELITVSLDDDLEYAALSYLWGDPQDQEIITVQGHEVRATKNLAVALSRLRRGESSLGTDRVWADAICIDQTHLAERSEQVQLMRRIYSSALVVYSWVGPTDYTLAFEALMALARIIKENLKDYANSETWAETLSGRVVVRLDWLRQHRNLCDPKDEPESPHRGNPWQAIASLVLERYWKRVWVFQEVALAHRLLLLSSGDTTLGWEDVRLVTATDPRDYIYGLLGVTRIPISPDYRPEKPLSELFVEYVAGWLNATRGETVDIFGPLSFLSIAGIGLFSPSDTLPSWVPNYPENARRNHPVGFINMGPINTISEELDCNHPRDFCSFLKSFLSRHAHYVSGVASLQAICQLLLTEKKSKPVTTQTVLLALGIASLVLDFEKVDQETAKEPPWHHEWGTRLYEFVFPGSDMQELGFTRTPQEEILSWCKDKRSQILSALDQELRKCNCFESESGYLGRAPLGAKRGDILCLLDGYDLPVLLRETKEGHHVFVGTVTVLDLDIHSLLRNMGSKAQWLELR
ncbi:heterokaryon incompatibility protein-domain-containing protein [Fusarium solani]|uniref:Heterokaryon incompatibility protein-domain-containing protein n=1 Tax=Fusarium solani TaxID=169388 RepID=A0A9P9K9M3_FUSSL|nr:heterokaryon incompatibility protein-domain-containing protein [Fusarium solani]KAH7253243.1 heterokaryon incompatibility protein-domain-containing protein [Fusarium solani]